MTVIELHQKLSEIIQQGHGHYDVKIETNLPDCGCGCGYAVFTPDTVFIAHEPITFIPPKNAEWKYKNAIILG